MDFNGSFAGDATVTLHFDPSLLGNTPVSDIYVEHYENGSWMIPSNQVIDTNNDTITFSTNGFSPFVLAAVPEPSTLALLGVGAVALIGWVWRRRNADQST